MKKLNFHSLLDINSINEPQSFPRLNGHELDELLTPVTCEDFVNTYFSRESLYVKGHPQKFDHIFSWEKLKIALARGEKIRDQRHNVTASFASGEASGSPRPMFEAHHNQVSELLNAGATICITNIHMADPLLAKWAQAIRTQLSFTGTVGVNCYISPDGAGLPMHYDKRVATTIQVAGKKRWRYSVKPAKPWPNDNEIYQKGITESSGVDVGTLPDAMECQEVELNPGDMLCLPAGGWHSAQGIGVSLALNLYFSPRNFLDQLIPLLHNFAISNEDWRGGPPATIEKIQGKMPSETSAYIKERLVEFHELALKALDGPSALTESWLNSLTSNPYTGWLAAPKLSIPEVSPDQRFRVENSLFRYIESHDKVAIPCDHGMLAFPTSLTPLLYRLASETSSFTIAEALSWPQNSKELSQDKIISYFKMLYSNGFLKMV